MPSFDQRGKDKGVGLGLEASAEVMNSKTEALRKPEVLTSIGLWLVWLDVHHFGMNMRLLEALSRALIFVDVTIFCVLNGI